MCWPLADPRAITVRIRGTFAHVALPVRFVWPDKCEHLLLRDWLMQYIFEDINVLLHGLIVMCDNLSQGLKSKRNSKRRFVQAKAQLLALVRECNYQQGLVVSNPVGAVPDEMSLKDWPETSEFLIRCAYTGGKHVMLPKSIAETMTDIHVLSSIRDGIQEVCKDMIREAKPSPPSFFTVTVPTPKGSKVTKFQKSTTRLIAHTPPMMDSSKSTWKSSLAWVFLLGTETFLGTYSGS